MIGFILSFIRKNLEQRSIRHGASRRLLVARHGDWPDDADDWIVGHLRDPDWEVRNVAVKMVGLGPFPAYIPHLIELLGNRTEPGFIRRNSATSLYQCGTRESNVLKAFREGLDDPYWEVRTESARGLAICGEPNHDLSTLLIGRIYRKPLDKIRDYPIVCPNRIYREKNFEVRAAMIRALGTALDDLTLIHALEIPLKDDLWKVREAALEGYLSAANRLNVPTETISDKIASLDLTCTEFKPMFPIRKTYNRLAESDSGNQTNNPSEIS